MKKFRTIGILALCALAIPSLTSCKDKDKDDEPGFDGPSGGSSSINAVIDFDGQLLTSIGDVDIWYDSKGRVEEVGDGYEDNIIINYSKGTIKFYESDGTIKFNNKGYISGLTLSLDDTYYDSWEGASFRSTGSGSYTFNYNSSNQLTSIDFKIKVNEKNLSTKESYDFEATTNVSLSWNKGNLVSTTWKVVEIEDGYRDTWNGRYNIEYGSKVNEFRQMPFAVSDYAIFDDYLMNTLASVGLFGVGTANLPIYLEEIDEGEYDYDINMSYSLNANGAIYKETYDYETLYYSYSNFNTRSSLDKQGKVNKGKTLMESIKNRIHKKTKRTKK